MQNHKVTYMCRGRLACLPKRIALAKIKSYIIQFMGTKTKWRVAVAVVQDGTVGRTYKSAPTVCVNFMDKCIDCAEPRPLGWLREFEAQAVTFRQSQYFFNSPMIGIGLGASSQNHGYADNRTHRNNYTDS